ncbi:MAG: PqqD family protein [Acidobacteriota bacterium]
MKWKTDHQGNVIILKPKFKNPFLVKHLLPRMKRPYYKVKLDEMGSYFWKNCDGEKNILEISELQKKKFRKKAEPVLDRISLFVKSLDRNNFIKFK